MTIARAGGDPRRAVMVGDSNTDIVAARNARIPVIAVPFGYTETPVRLLGPDRVIEHFDELFECGLGADLQGRRLTHRGVIALAQM